MRTGPKFLVSVFLGTDQHVLIERMICNEDETNLVQTLNIRLINNSH